MWSSTAPATVERATRAPRFDGVQLRRALPLLRELGCALTEQELSEQRVRARSLSAHLVEAARDAGVLTLRFDERVDEALVRAVIETERRCCPFFRIEHDPVQRRVDVSVARETDRPALDALAELFAAG